MIKKILAICDAEETYLHHLMSFLETKHLPFEIRAYTSTEQLQEFLEHNKAEILLLAENAYMAEAEALQVSQIVLLSESGNAIGNGLASVRKYQSADSLYRELAEYLAVQLEDIPEKADKGGKLQVIGIYTPVRRCLQTTFALCLGQMLAQKHKTLYLNFEAYSGFRHLLQKEFRIDITDLLYYFGCEKNKLAFRLEGMVEKINQLHFVPPVFSHMDLESIEGSQWIELIRQIERTADYEYLILDLTESMQGLYEILRLCTRVFTITKEDNCAEAKILHYEELLKMAEYDDILGKTIKRQLPVFRQLPQRAELLTHGELAAYVKNLIEEDIYEQGGGV